MAFSKRLIKNTSSLGALPAGIFLMLIVGLLGRWDIALQLAIATLASYILGGILRALFFRERPRPRKWTTRFERLDAGSFPSLHAARMGLIATILSWHIHTLLAAVSLVAIGLVVLWTRWRLKRHYVGDLVGGAVLGVLCGAIGILIG